MLKYSNTQLAGDSYLSMLQIVIIPRTAWVSHGMKPCGLEGFWESVVDMTETSLTTELNSDAWVREAAVPSRQVIHHTK